MSITLAAITGYVTLALFGQAPTQTTAEEAKERLGSFESACKKAKTAAEFVTAIRELGAVRHPSFLAVYRKFLHESRFPSVRAAAAEQIGSYAGDKTAAGILVNAAAYQKDVTVLAKCLSAAGETGVRGIAVHLIPFLRHRDTGVALEAVRACGRLRSRESIAPLIQLLRTLEPPDRHVKLTGLIPNGPQDDPNKPPLEDMGQMRRDIQARADKLLTPTQEALREITGQSLGTANDWNSWWRRNRGNFQERP